MLDDARVNRVSAHKHRFTFVPTALRRRLLRRCGHSDVHFAVDDGQERPRDVLPRELRVRSFYDTKSTDEAALALSGPDSHLLALLFAIGSFVRENSGERFGVRPCVVAPPFRHRPRTTRRPDDVRERGQRHMILYIITRRVGLRFERARGFGVLHARCLHGEECRFRSRPNGSLFHPLFSNCFLKLTRRRDMSRAPRSLAT